MKTTLQQRCFMVSIVLLLAGFAPADTYWQGTTGNWSTGSNWTSGEPTSSDYAYINNGGTAQITSGNGEDCYSN